MLIETIKADAVAARRARATAEVTFLSTLVAEASAAAMSGRERRDIVDADVIASVAKMEKGLLETRQHTADTAAIDQELAWLRRYKPVQLSSDELATAIAAIIDEGNTKIGDVMRVLKQRHGGTYDGAVASALVKESLAG